MNKPIIQNPERYTKEGNQWKISASKNIKPIYLPIGVEIQNLKPVIKSDGIIVKIGGDYLCSLTTLNSIKESNNPHYDIVENGSVTIKGKKVSIGKTIKIIELDVVKLQSLIDSREFMNRQSGVVSISYINNPNELVDGIPKKLIDQINYTLDRESERPSDKFEVVDYFSMVDKKNNPNASHYTIKPIRIVTDQQETIFDPLKLQTFIIELSDQLKLLKNDFNTLQKTFFDGVIPAPNRYGLIVEDIIARTDVDDLDSNHSVKTNESSEIVSIDSSPIQTVKSELDRTKNELIDTQEEFANRLQVEQRQNLQRVESLEEQLEQKIQSGQSNDRDNQNYLARKVVELQEQIKKIQTK